MKKVSLLPHTCPLLFILVFAISCNGQADSKVSPTPETTPKTDAQIDEYVVELFEDSKGNLWFGTMSSGVACYDGKTLRYFSQNDGLAGNTVACITEDKEGNMWFGTHSGLSKYNGITFISFTKKEGLCNDRVANILIDKAGNIWIGATGVGVYRYDGKLFNIYKGTNRMDLTYRFGVQDILEDRNGRLWFSFSGGLFRLIGSSIINVTQNGPWN